MVTADSVKTKLRNLISSANATTGESDTTLTDAVNTLIGGFGKGGITPSGTKSITANGTYDVTNYASAEVNVPTSGITPSGSLNITENGTHDVTNYASAVVNVPTTEQNYVVVPISIASDMGAGTNTNQAILSGHDFVKEHYADEGFSALFIPLSATTAADSGVFGPLWLGNRPLFTTKSTYYGFGLRSSGATSGPTMSLNTAKLNGNGYNVSLRANSSGNINLYVASSYTVKAGSYLLVLFCIE